MTRARPGLCRGYLVLLLVTLMATACAPAPTLVDTPQTRIYALINERLSYMADVAAYKYERQLPVEDLAREATILDSVTQQAAEAGLDAASVTPFFEAQFRAAKRIQATVMLELEAERYPASGYRDLTTEVRPALDRIGKQLIDAIVASLSAGHTFSTTDQANFDAVVDNAYLTAGNREALLSALAEIRLAEASTG